FVTFMSFLLILSSVTMVRAVQEGHRENKKGVIFWMLLTIIGGLGFLSCQAWEWTNLIGNEGMSVTKNPFSAHLDAGTYISGEELSAAGFQKITKNIHGHEATYYLAPGTTDLEENRYFVKSNHHGEEQVGETFEVSDPYLITKNHETHLYEYGAYKTAEGSIGREELGPIAFGSLFFFITGFHGFHVFSGVVFLLIILMNVASGLYAKRRNGYEMVEKIGLYWHFVDLVWVFVFLVFYLL
ncbi:MAG TPA: cytochrome oxidase subunit III, partial [Bacteroidetes bacterium]|nr:cytochrome oxidase subunit III [Bacteroidota bacterium]